MSEQLKKNSHLLMYIYRYVTTGAAHMADGTCGRNSLSIIIIHSRQFLDSLFI